MRPGPHPEGGLYTRLPPGVDVAFQDGRGVEPDSATKDLRIEAGAGIVLRAEFLFGAGARSDYGNTGFGMKLRGAPWRVGASLLGAAEGPREKLGIIRYALRNLTARLFGTGSEEITVSLRGVRYHVESNAGELSAYLEVYLQQAYERLPSFVPAPDSIVLDVGANVGMFTLRQAFRGARVFAFEPNPDAFNRLERNIRENHLSSRATAFPCALGERTGRAGLIRTGATIMTRMTVDGGEEVDVRTLDDVVRELELERIAILKVDVEGAEGAVLRGGRRALSRTERVVMEYHSPELLAEVRAVLGNAGFKEVYVDPSYVYFTSAALAGTA